MSQNFDQKRLAKALRFHNYEKINFTRSTKFSLNLSSHPKPLCVGNEEIKIPVSLLDFEKLKLVSQEAKCGKGKNLSCNSSMKNFREISSSRISSTPLQKHLLFETSSYIKDQLELPPELAKVELEFVKVHLYETGHHYGKTFQYSLLDENVVGSVFVQVPVEGGHDGGNLHVKYHGERKRIDNHVESNIKFYSTVILDRCEYWMEPLTRGSNLILVYNLKWKSTNKNNEMPHDVPAFLFAMKEMKEIFSDWVPPPIPLPGLTDPQVDGDFEPRNPSSIALERKILYFCMEGEYENCTTFHNLEGRDRRIALLLRSCLFLEVFLGKVSRKMRYAYHEDSSDDEGGDKFKLKELVDSWGRTISLTFELDSEKHFSGFGQELIDAAECSTGNHFKVLIVCPKHNTFNFLCHFGLPSLVCRIESSHENKENQRRELHELVAVCSQENAIRALSPKYGTCVRLLQLCTRLNASQEGLAVLKMLGKSLQKAPPLKNAVDRVAKAIAEFECVVTGWEGCAKVIKGMIQSHLIWNQLQLAFKLSECFLEVNCPEGAKVTLDSILSVLSVASDGKGKNLHKADVHALLNLIISLEEDSSVRNLERFSSLATIFTKLNSSLQCKLALDWESKYEPHWKTLPWGTAFFDSVCAGLSCCKVFERPVPTDTIIEIIQFYVRRGNQNWMQRFVSSLIKPCHSSGQRNEYSWSEMRQETAIGDIVLSPILWDLAISSELGKLALTSLMKNLVSNLKMKRNFTRYVPGIPSETENRKKFPSFLKLAMQMECTPNLADPNRIAALVSKCSKLNFEQLSRLLIDIAKSNSEQLNKQPTNLSVIESISRKIVRRLANEKIRLDVKTTLEVVRCFLQLLGIESASNLVKKICAHLFTVDWSQQKVITDLLIEIIGSTIWNELESLAKLRVLKACIVIVEHSIDYLTEQWNANHSFVISLQESVRCVQVFFLMEKNRSLPNQKDLAPGLDTLFAILPLETRMKIMVDIHQKEVSAIPNIKKFTNCMDWFRKQCRTALNQDFVNDFIVKNQVLVVNLIKCLVWLSDAEAWQSFTSRVCHSSKSLITSSLADTLRKPQYLDVCKAFANSPLAFEAFNRITVFAKDVSNRTVLPEFTWEQPRASVPGHPTVQSFLRSPAETMTYENFKGIAEARDFSSLLEFPERISSEKTFSVTARACGKGASARCVITKSRVYYNTVNRKAISLKNKMNKFLELKAVIESLRDSNSLLNPTGESSVSNATTSIVDDPDVVLVVPPKKRAKVEVPTVDLID